MNPGQVIFLVVLLTAASHQVIQASPGSAEVTIGELAHRGYANCQRMWGPTIAYLTQHVPGRQFRLIPLDLNDMSAELERGGLDFLLTNPGNYVELERRFGATRITTLKNLRQDQPYKVFGAVIFSRADREDIQQLSDLKGKAVAAVSKSAFGGFQMAWRELKEAGIDPYRDFSSLHFLGFPQDVIVEQVLNGRVDAGTVRTDTLERMASEGRIRLEDFHILNAQHSNEFPFRHSTRLYPEWAFAKAKPTPEELARKVTIALMQMSLASRGQGGLLCGLDSASKLPAGP